MTVILKGQTLTGQNADALDRVVVAGRKNFPGPSGSRVPLTYRVTDVGRGAVIRVENAHPIPTIDLPIISRSGNASCVIFATAINFRGRRIAPASLAGLSRSSLHGESPRRAKPAGGRVPAQLAFAAGSLAPKCLRPTKVETGQIARL